MHVKIDNNTDITEDIGKTNNESKRFTVDVIGNGYAYGAHVVKIWFVTDDGASSNVITMPFLYNNGSSTEPILGATLSNYSINEGETLYLKYVCYTPGHESTDSVSVRLYAIEEQEQVNYYTTTLTNVPNNTENQLPITDYPSSGTAYIELTSGNTVTTVQFSVTEYQSDYDLTQVTTGLVYAYRPTGYTNNSANKESYVYSFRDAKSNTRNIYSTLTDFNWVSDGYLDGESLTISGDARMNIALPIFTEYFTNADNQVVYLDSQDGATVTSNGRTIEFEFELDSVTNQNDVVFTCMNNDNVGFVITPQVCYLLSDGQTLVLDNTGFIENEESIPCAYIKDEKRIRVSFVIQKAESVDDRFVSCVNIFINGEYANSYLYDAAASYESNATITIGSNSCITKLYDVRMYNYGLTDAEVLRNYMNADLDIRQRNANNERNDVLNGNLDVEYSKAIYDYPCLLIIGELSKYKGDKQKCGFVLTKPDGNGGYTVEFSLLDQDDNGNFICELNVQGTSSQKFIRKNYKTKLARYKRDGNGDFILSDGAKQSEKVKYVLKGYDTNGNPLSIGESTLCYKIDYMSTDHANTFNANIADTLFNDKPAGSLVQNTVWGFRCLLFHMDKENYVAGRALTEYAEGAIEFAGDGCLNNDKSNTKTFGLETNGDSGNVTTQQKWEFKDNSNILCTFKSDELMKKIYNEDLTYKLQAQNGLESCYPDEGDLEDAGLAPDYQYIQLLYTWVCQRANYLNASTSSGTGGTYNGTAYDTEYDLKKAIFRNEFTLHFNLEHALVYYLFIEWVASADNRAKNMFLSCKNVGTEHIAFTDSSTSIWDIVNMETGAVDESKIDWSNSTFGVWYTDLYDLDSCFGAENSGYIRVPYYADWNYKLGRTNTYQFNGHDSVLWCMFEDAFADEIKARAKTLTNDSNGGGALNYGVLKKYHITDNAELVCPAVVNRDMGYKYEDAWTEGYWDYSEDENNPTFKRTKDYKYLQRGSRTEQKESFIYRRSVMLYSKYQTNQFIQDRITFRAGSAVNIADSEITLTPVQTMYMGITYGDSGSPTMSAKKAAGENAAITSPTNMGRSDTVYIHGASNLTNISSLAAFHPYEIQLSNAGKLKTLLIGSDASGYSNGDLSGLDTSNCALLETLNVQGCTGFGSTPIDLTHNPLIKHVYAKGSNVPYFTFVNGGILETLQLGTPQRIVLMNMPNLQTFSYDSLSSLNYLRVEGVTNVGVFDILASRLSGLTRGIRLVNIEETITGNDYSVFTALISNAAKGKRLNADGNLVNDPTAYPVISGIVHCDVIGSQVKTQMETIYPDLTIDATTVIDQFAVTFKNADGTNIKDLQGNDYVQYVDRGSVPVDPITAGYVATPTLAATAQYTYTFSSWSGISSAVISNKTITAQYTSTLRSYTVRWFAKTGDNSPLKSVTADYGTAVKYSDTAYDYPVRTDGETTYVYNLFKGWNKSTNYITGNTDVYALWETGALPELGEPGAALDQMNAATVYGVAMTDNVTNYFTDKDHIDIQLGQDFDFVDNNNQPIYQVLARNLLLDGTGTGIVDTGIKLFDANEKSFVLAIDFNFTGTTADNTLVSCYENDSQMEGFRLRFTGGASGKADIQWVGLNQNCGNQKYRDIVVLRHVQGEKKMNKVSKRRRKWVCANIHSILNSAYIHVMELGEMYFEASERRGKKETMAAQIIDELNSMEKPLYVYWNVCRIPTKEIRAWDTHIRNEIGLLHAFLTEEGHEMNITILDWDKIEKVSFLKNMSEFHRYIHGKVINANSQYDASEGSVLIRLADDAFYHVYKANEKLPASQKEYKKRKEHISKAISALNSMNRQSLFYFNLMQYSERVMREWADMLSQELKMLYALQKSDKARFQDLP